MASLNSKFIEVMPGGKFTYDLMPVITKDDWGEETNEIYFSAPAGCSKTFV